MKTNRSIVRLFVVLMLAAFGLLSIGAQKAAAQAANLDQCRNGTAASPQNCDEHGGGGWFNGNVGAQNSHYAEGGSLPYRMFMSGLTAGQQYTLQIGYDIKHSSKHAIDYLTTVNRPGDASPSAVVDPCDGLTGLGNCAVPSNIAADFSNLPAGMTAIAVPTPTNCVTPASLGYNGGVAGTMPCASFLALPLQERVFLIKGGTFIGGGSAPNYSKEGSLTAAQDDNRIHIRFTASQATAVITWGGHVAWRAQWGFIGTTPVTAGGISGSPYHMRLEGLCAGLSNNCTDGGNQDRSLSADAVISPASITIIKNCDPASSPESFTFNVTAQPGTELTTPFNLPCVDAAATTTVFENQKMVDNILTFGTYTIVEAAKTGWALDTLVCTGGDGDDTENVGTRTASFNLEQGENMVCTFTNRRLQGTLNYCKNVINNNGGTAVAADWTLTVYSGTNSSGTVIQFEAGTASSGLTCNNSVLVDEGDYFVAENTKAGYSAANPFFATADCSDATNGALPEGAVHVAAGGTVTCILNNDDISPTLRVNKLCNPTNDTGKFNLRIDGATAGSGADAVCTTGTTGVVPVNAGAHTVSETAGTGTNLANYSAVIGGQCAADGTVSLALGENKVCTITNSRPDMSIKVLTTGTNEVNDDHVFTVTVTIIPNGASVPGTVNITRSVSPTPDVNTTTCGAAVAVVANVATCTVTVNDTEAGVFEVDASVTATVGGVSITRDTAGTSGPGGNSGASKTFVDASIAINPPSANNPIGAPHVITATVRQNTGSGGFVAAPDGVTVTFSLQNAGGATAAFVGGNTCLTAGGTGTCTVTINSATAGTVTINATTTFSVGGVSLTRDTNPATGAIGAGPGGSGPATKTYQSGTIIIDKVTIPAADPLPFTFTPSYNGGATFQLADATAPNNSGQLAPGTYSVAETVPAGWDLTSATCSDSSPVTAISLQANETVTCTFTNTKRGGITIIKEVVVGTNEGATAADDFTFDPSAGVNTNTNFLLDDDSDATLPKQRSFTSVAPGVHTVAELAAPGWDLFSITCVDSVGGGTASTGSPATRTATINLDPAETVTCTFKNRQAEMPVTKLIDGRTPDCTQPNPNQNPANPFDDNLCTDPVMGNVLNLFGIQLFAAGFPDDATDVDTNPGFPNSALSPVIPIPPVFEPAAPVGVPFTICEVAIPTGWALPQTNDVVFTPTPLPGGFDTTPVVYDPAPSSRNRCFDLTIPAGTTEFAISINNVPLSKIIVDKNTVPAGDATLFTFTPTGWDGATFQLAHATAVKDSGFIAGGSYAVAETVPTGWDLTNLVCTSTIPAGGAGTSSFTYTPGANGTGFGAGDTTANITLQNGATTTCVFTNTKRAKLIIKKVMVGGTATFGFSGPSGDTGSIAVNNGTFERDNLVPGSYNWSENALAGWDLTDLQCDDANSVETIATRTAGVVLEAGETVTCTFTNTKRPTLRVDKICLPANDTGLFNLRVDAANWGSGANKACGTNTGAVESTIGLHTVSETAGTNTNLADYTTPVIGGDCASNGNITLTAGQNAVCTITNTRRGNIVVIKDSVPDDAWDFNFTAGGSLSPANFILEDNGNESDGVLRQRTFSNVAPNTTTGYLISEINDTAVSGFLITGIVCTNPDGQNASTIDLVAGTATVKVNPGETVTCTFTNTRQIGAHTIGYWSNWNTCTGGKQVENEALHPEKWLLDEVIALNPNPLLIGVDGPDADGLVDVVRTCSQGVSLLRKRDIVTKENRANDGAYNMTAQLIAALSNYAAGSTQCGTVTQVINLAKALLVEIQFTGTGEYLEPGDPLRNYAIQLGSILDTYNNSNASACSATIPTHP
jgi:hypothetical protein